MRSTANTSANRPSGIPGGFLLPLLARNNPRSGNQCFVDGNKRIAWFAGKTFLRLNGLNLVASADEGKELFRERVAKGMSVEELAVWLERHSMDLHG